MRVRRQGMAGIVPAPGKGAEVEHAVDRRAALERGSHFFKIRRSWLQGLICRFTEGVSR
jgi:hypothetical protein